MIWIFTCSNKGCENNTTPVYLCDALNPVTCSLCYAQTDAIETSDPCLTVVTEEAPAVKAKK